jgi:rhamnose utilization protein RhaD (predicted bifunctional aldolase and dehydrogenase)
MPPPRELIELAHAMADPALDAAILAEGNVSASCGPDSFWIKASGCSMVGANESSFVEVSYEPVLQALDNPSSNEVEVRKRLNDARIDPNTTALPSTETFMHAYLLSLPEIRFVAHTHPTPLLSLLSLESGADLAKRRLFPDEIVLCGAAACWVPYVAPGLPLALEIIGAVTLFQAAYGVHPKTIWLENHGLITLGKTAKEAESATRMSVKAARVALGALQTGQPIRWLEDSEVQQIGNWPDEHYRQRLLWE